MHWFNMRLLAYAIATNGACLHLIVPTSLLLQWRPGKICHMENVWRRGTLNNSDWTVDNRQSWNREEMPRLPDIYLSGAYLWKTRCTMSMGIHLESIKVYVTECNMFSKTLSHISTANAYKRLGLEEVSHVLLLLYCILFMLLPWASSWWRHRLLVNPFC